MKFDSQVVLFIASSCGLILGILLFLSILVSCAEDTRFVKNVCTNLQGQAVDCE